MKECSSVSSLARRAGYALFNHINACAFAILDIVDQLLCPLFALLDSFLDSEPTVCYCRFNVQHGHLVESAFGKELNGGTFIGDQDPLENWIRSSDTLYASVRKSGPTTAFHRLTAAIRKTLTKDFHANEPAAVNPDSKNNLSLESKTLVVPVVEGHGQQLPAVGVPIVCSDLRNLAKQSVSEPLSRTTVKHAARWSDCGCQRCTSWQSDEDQLLHVYVDDKDVLASLGNGINVTSADKNVIFLHGFLSSSSFWADTVLPALPEAVRSSHRLFALDIMGFGKSPKPSNSLYTIADHIDMIRRSVIEPHGIQSFHLVAHSMGCTIALALAARYSSALKSITLIAPPYFPAVPGTSSSCYLLQNVAPRRVWPLMTFGASVMSWYEHIGRVVCLVVCKHHRFWEPLLLFVLSNLLRKRIPLSWVSDFTHHTHHAAWHTFHNTICNGGHTADHSLKVLLEAGQRVRVIHGTKDSVIPFNCSVILSHTYPNVHLTPVASADHVTVVFGQEEKLANELAEEILLNNSLPASNSLLVL